MRFYPGLHNWPDDLQCSRATALKLCAGKLPKAGYEKKVEISGKFYWLEWNPYRLDLCTKRPYAFYLRSI